MISTNLLRLIRVKFINNKETFESIRDKGSM